MQSLIHWLLGISGSISGPAARVWCKRALLFAIAELSLILSFDLRFDFRMPEAMRPAFLLCAAVCPVLQVIALTKAGACRQLWSYFSPADFSRQLAACILSTAVAGGLLMAFSPFGLPRSVLLIDFVLCMLFIAVLRVTIPLAIDLSATAGAREHNTLIYGAGAAGRALLSECRQNSALPWHICGFIDDEPRKRGMLLHGVPVLGSGEELAAIALKHGITKILIAVPSADGAAMARIVGHCRSTGVQFLTIPSLSEIVAGRGLSGQIREVAVEDLLGRKPVQLDHQEICRKLHGKVALVTGAGGSIGSELCRQIARFQPAAIVAFEAAETPAFHLAAELSRTHPGVKLHVEIGNIQNVQRLNEVFAKYRPAMVCHAAAYKHVPMMEANVFEAVENNVIGAFNVAVASMDYAVEDFVMISSDKAVRPTNIMGASKRVAELVIRSLQNGGPRFVSVRFGNVLGSNGSVVPIFKQQIAAGGPVTVTHPEMRRYFMTIPEAVQLVLQASTMGKGGEIFVLDMGEPVRIVDLARQLITLSGLRPDKDIKIEFTGMRPGEKLYEEISLAGEATTPTFHEKICIFAGECPSEELMSRSLAQLRSACRRRDLPALILCLKSLVPDYSPSRELLETAFRRDLVALAKAVEEDQTTLALLPVEEAAC